MRRKEWPVTPIVLNDEAVLDAERGDVVTPPRLSADLGDGRMVFTTGARNGEWFGYRSYDTFGFGRGQQVVVLHDWQNGAVLPPVTSGGCGCA